ncbi:ATP-dependent DNA helicase Rep [Pseudomethylobacillus aquaticus]|uniref:ATP-dependent DNA helicase Rep n=1 Tax=Pseudomethylobacillus aquaticus TaxID=2676064 RepID=A0A3N0UYC9_9PROT|nr:UvrD-helicase domain-containing protein [Pseudomethylobacillus aquaticus]ROH85530.1 ATP-dependent DNA helicase Rep [Pseudomethylobacillus aquaticus]
MLSKLNAPQREAAKYLDGPLLVLAGAGSGKTRVITHKIVYLIEQCGYSPREIAAITFTNKAAREMQERVAQLMEGKSTKGLTIATFHSLGLQMLRAEAALLGYKPQFSILDSADSFKILSDVLATTDKQLLRKTQWQISSWKNAFMSPDQAKASADDELKVAAAKVYQLYQQTLKAYQAVDFDDLIKLPVELFEQHPQALEKWQRKLKYLLIDEYQDTNSCQYRLVKLLTGIEGRFTAVGDDDQAIYGWRGADVENLRQLTEDFSRLKVIKLEQNYRSTVRILRAANQVIANNPKLFDKKLWSDLGTGEQLQVSAARDEDHEAESVVMKLMAHKFEHRTRHADYAILYRGNHQARIIEQQLRNNKIPYTISGGQSFFDKAEIKDIVSYLRLIANEDDDPAFIRAATTPKKGIGNTTLERLGTYASAHHLSLFAAAFEGEFQRELGNKQLDDLLTFCQYIQRLQERAVRDPAGEVLDDLLNGIQYEAFLYDSEESRSAETKWNNLQEFIGWLKKKSEPESEGGDDGRNLLELTQMVSLMSMLEGRENGEPDAVKLSTLHAAKGLEYGHVFLIGCEEGILPHRESIDTDRVEEERRLMYVGITRAQKSLHISWCRKRKRAGETEACEPSRFIAELPADDVRHFGSPSADPVASKEHGRERMAQIRAMLGK